jgi:hypothetical protein
MSLAAYICTCPASEDSSRGIAKEKRRAELFKLHTKLVTIREYNTKGSWQQALSISQHMGAIQRSEGLESVELAEL